MSYETVYQEYCRCFNKPDEEPRFPNDITVVSDDELGRLLNLYTRWRGYATLEVAKADADIHMEKELLRIQEAVELIRLNSNPDLRNEYKSAVERTAYVTQLPNIQLAIQSLAKLQALYKVEKAVQENFENRYSSISREITRRED